MEARGTTPEREKNKKDRRKKEKKEEKKEKKKEKKARKDKQYEEALLEPFRDIFEGGGTPSDEPQTPPLRTRPTEVRDMASAPAELPPPAALSGQVAPPTSSTTTGIIRGIYPVAAGAARAIPRTELSAKAKMQVAILLLRLFPPDMLHGVALGELHQRNGNSLLHLVSSFQQFDSQSEGLFAMLFERMPEALRMHRNLKGQSFLHVAAGRRNFWVLRYAAARGLASLFSVADSVGYTPRKLLEQHLAQLHIQPPRLRAAFGDTRLPTWCTFGSLKPGSPRETRPFSDVCVEVEWKGTVTKLDAHRVILATGSPLWHQQLRERGTQGGAEPQVLQVECPSMEVVTYALGYLYTGDLEGCSFQKDAERLLQLLQLCHSCKLPPVLIAFALESLLLEIRPSMIPSLLLEAKQYQLPAQARQFLALQFLIIDEAWQAAAEAEVSSASPERGQGDVSKRSEVLTAALNELERPVSNFLG
eukprot:s1711_g12.t1